MRELGDAYWWALHQQQVVSPPVINIPYAADADGDDNIADNIAADYDNIVHDDNIADDNIADDVSFDDISDDDNCYSFNSLRNSFICCVICCCNDASQVNFAYTVVSIMLFIINCCHRCHF